MGRPEHLPAIGADCSLRGGEKTLKNGILAGGFLMVAAVALFVLGMAVANQFRADRAPITVHEVAPGVKCARTETSRGAAISCWSIHNDDHTQEGRN